MGDGTSDLALRLERVERQNKRLLRWGGLAFGAVCAGWLTSMLPVCKTVWAERFVLQDSQGSERAVLTAYETGGAPSFSLLGKNGKAVATLSVQKDGGAYLALFDSKGERNLRLSMNADGTPNLEGAACQGKSTEGAQPKAPEKKSSDTVSSASR